MFVEYDMLGRQYSISALMKQDNITEMHIYVKFEIVSFMHRHFFQSQSLYKNWPKIKKTKKNKNKNKKQNKSRDLHKDCVSF